MMNYLNRLLKLVAVINTLLALAAPASAASAWATTPNLSDEALALAAGRMEFEFDMPSLASAPRPIKITLAVKHWPEETLYAKWQALQAQQSRTLALSFSSYGDSDEH